MSPKWNNRNERFIRLDSPKRSHANKCFNSDARTSVSPARLHFLPAETALTRNWHSPRSHSGTLSSRKRSGSLGGKKTSTRIAFYTKRRTTIFAKPISRTKCKPSIFLRPPPPPFFFFHYMVANHDRVEILFLDRFCFIFVSNDASISAPILRNYWRELSRDILYLEFFSIIPNLISLLSILLSQPNNRLNRFCSDNRNCSR